MLSGIIVQLNVLGGERTTYQEKKERKASHNLCFQRISPVVKTMSGSGT